MQSPGSYVPISGAEGGNSPPWNKSVLECMLVFSTRCVLDVQMSTCCGISWTSTSSQTAT